MAKLHIPAPDGVDDRSDVNLAMFAAFLLFCLLAVLMFRGAEKAPEVAKAAATPGETPRDIYDELADQRALAARIGQASRAELEARSWTDAERQAVLRFGPREATEVVCTKAADAIVADTLPKELRLEFEKTLDRRTEFAPWTCMTRLFLSKTLPQGSLLVEMTEWWVELEAHKGNERIPISVLEEFRTARERPDNKPFYAWLRMCALDFDYAVHAECQKLLAQMAPEHGADLLGMLERHFFEYGARPEDMPVITAGLGYLARNGQPHSFKVAETDALPDYDVDFRQAAVGYLCRMMNSPTPRERNGQTSPLDVVPELAGEQLRKTALVGARAYEEKLVKRWREACRIAFGGGANEDRTEFTPVPMLAVWNGDVESLPRYEIQNAIELGTCKRRTGHPDWYCLAAAWKDEERALDAALAHAFIRTRYMEWDDAWE